MRIYYYFLTSLLLLACDSETASDCLKSPGTAQTITFDLDDFSKVSFFEGVELEIKQGLENKIEITYGKNVLNQVETNINDERLSIVNNIGCGLLREFDPAKVVLTAININEIRNASQFEVFSIDTLRFETLTLISENAEIDFVNVGDFNLKVNNINLTIISNNVSNFSISGFTKNLFVGFYAGQSQFKGRALHANNVDLFHRGINEIQVWPIMQITGQIRASGNVISFNRPPVIDVKEFYTGQLYFRD